MNAIAEAIYANSVKPIIKVKTELKIRYIKRGTSHEAIMAEIRERIKAEEKEWKTNGSNTNNTDNGNVHPNDNRGVVPRKSRKQKKQAQRRLKKRNKKERKLLNKIVAKNHKIRKENENNDKEAVT